MAFAGVGSDAFDGQHPHVFVNALLGLFGALALMVAAIVLFRSQRAENALTGEDESAIRGLLELYGKNDSLGYFATRRDKAAVFAPNGRAAITYRVEVGVCLASGDPVGDPKAWPQAIEAWLRLCQEYGWAPGVMGASSAAAEAFREAGLNALQLGDEAILHPDGFRLSGPDMRAVRQAVTRARRAGLTVRIRRHRDISPDEMAEVIKRADAWRDTESERGFSMALGRLGDPADGDCLLVEAMQNQDERRRHAVACAVGHQRGLARPDAPLAAIAQRHNRTDGDRAVPAVGRHWGQPYFAELRDVPVGVRAGRAARRRPDSPVVARPAGVLLALVAARDPVPIEHEVPARVGAALRVLRRRSARPAGRRRVGYRRGLPGAAVLAAKQAAAHRTSHCGAGESGRDGSAASRRQRARPERACRPICPRTGTSRACPSRCASGWPNSRACRTAAWTPTPSGSHPATPSPRRSTPPTAPGVTVAGRVLRVRDYGGVLFAQLRDWSGEVQLLLDNSRLDTGSTADFTGSIDLGDLIEVTGTMGQSRSGTRSLIVGSWRLIGKCLRPLPDKWKGLTDQEARVRARYVDLAINTEARELIRARSGVLHAIRETLVGKGFLEVETPILQQIHGGANARPFLTHINAYDLDLYLRIAPELYLKRLCVGGVERVFELGRAFRNEGVDFSHNPEFTLLEAYQAHADYNVWIDGCRELIQNAALAANGEHVFLRPRDDGTLEKVDISGQWAVKTVHGAVSEALGEQIGPETDLTTLRRLCDAADIPYLTHWDAGAVVLELYERLVEDQHRGAHLLQGLPDVGVAADPAAPQHPRGGRTLGPGGMGCRAGHRLQRTHRPGRTTQAAAGTVAAGGRWRPGGDGARRGLPAGHGVRDAADGRSRHGRGPGGHVDHRTQHPRDAAVPAGQTSLAAHSQPATR